MANPQNINPYSDDLARIVVDLSTAEIATLGSSPVEIVAAPGAGKVIVPAIGLLHIKAGTQPWADAAQSPVLAFPDYPTTSALMRILGDVALYEVESYVYKFIDLSSTAGADPLVSFSADQDEAENQPLLFTTDLGADPTLTGSILSKSVGAGGAGYAPGDTGEIDDLIAGTTALYTVDTVSGGAVTGFTITNAGTQYYATNGAATTVLTGGGDGAFTVNILTITNLSDGVGRLWLEYGIMNLRV